MTLSPKHISTSLIVLLCLALLTACGDAPASSPTSTPQVVAAIPRAASPAQPTHKPVVVVILVTATPFPSTSTPIVEPTTIPTSTPQPPPPPTDTAVPTNTPLSTPTPVPSVTSTPLPEGVVNDNDVNLRAGPGFNYPSLGKYSRGTNLHIVGKNTKGDWLEVVAVQGSTSKIDGWMLAKFVDVNIDVAAMPIVTPSPAPPTPTAVVTKATATVDGPVKGDIGVFGGELADGSFSAFEVKKQGSIVMVSIRISNMDEARYQFIGVLETAARHQDEKWTAVTIQPLLPNGNFGIIYTYSRATIKKGEYIDRPEDLYILADDSR